MAQTVERSTGNRRVASLRLTADWVTVMCNYPLLRTGSNHEDRPNRNQTNKLIDVGPSLNTD